MPLSTGIPGGKLIGQRMSEYSIEGARFEQEWETHRKGLHGSPGGPRQRRRRRTSDWRCQRGCKKDVGFSQKPL